MKKINSFYPSHLFWVVWVSLLFGLGACKQDPETPNPCAALKATRAAFVIEESFGRVVPWKWDYYATDTVCRLIIRLNPVDSSGFFYEWQIGAGKYQKRNIEIEFPESVLGTSIPITLIMKKTPNLSCFPQDDGIDTVRKYVHFLPETETLIKGEFTGHYEDVPNEEFTILIDPSRYNTTYKKNQIYINNLVRGCDRYFIKGLEQIIGYREMVFFDGAVPNCELLAGIAKLATNRSELQVFFYYTDRSDPKLPTKTRSFIGKRKS